MPYMPTYPSYQDPVGPTGWISALHTYIDSKKPGGIDITKAPYNCDPTGTVACTSAFMTADDDARTQGTYITAPPGSTFKVGQMDFAAGKSPWWEFEDVTLLMDSGGTYSGAVWIQYKGVLGTQYSLTADAAEKTDTLQISPANAVSLNVAANDLILIGSTFNVEPTSRPTEYMGQIVKVKSINTSTGVIILGETINRQYLMSQSSFVQKVSYLVRPRIKGVTFQNYSPLSNIVWQLIIKNARDVEVRTRHIDSDSIMCCLWNCYNFESHTTVKNGADDLAAARYGYGMCAMGATCHGTAYVHANKCRHAFTTNGTSTAPDNHGEPHDIMVFGEAAACTAAAFDTHEAGYNIVFNNVTAVGNFGPGGQIRSAYTKFSGGEFGFNPVGISIAYPARGQVIDGAHIHHTHKNGTIAAEYGGNTSSGEAIRINMPTYAHIDGLEIVNCIFEEIYMQVVRVGGGAGDNANMIFANNIVRNYSLSNTSGERSLIQPGQRIVGLRMFGNKVSSSLGGLPYIFYGSGNDSNGNALWGSDCAAWDNDWGSVPEFAGGQETLIKTWNNSSNGVKYKRKLAATFAANPTINLSICPEYEFTLTGNMTGLTFTGGTDGQEFRLTFVQDATGSRTVAFASITGLTIDWGAAGVPTLRTAVGALDTFLFMYRATGPTLVRI